MFDDPGLGHVAAPDAPAAVPDLMSDRDHLAVMPQFPVIFDVDRDFDKLF